MKREDIDKAAEEFCEVNRAIEYPDFFADFAIEQVNKALEEAAKIVIESHYEYCRKHNRYPCGLLAEYEAEAIRALKIKD